MKITALQARNTHPYGFRSGTWALVTGVAMMAPGSEQRRPIYILVYEDGTTDYVSFDTEGLEFRGLQP